MGRKGSEVSPSKRYPLRSAHSTVRVLRSASTKGNEAYTEPWNDSAVAQSAVKKRENGSPSVSPNNSARVLRSASKNTNDACSEPLNDRTTAKPAANKRKTASPSQVGSLSNTVRVLRSALINKDEACSDPITNSPAGEPAANKRKIASPSKLESPRSSVRVLRSGSKYKNKTQIEPLNDSTAVEPAANRRKIASPSKLGSPNDTVRVLRSALKNKNEAFSDLLNESTIGQPNAKRRKSGSPLKVASPNSSARVLRSTSQRKNEACNEPLNDNTAAQPAVGKRKGGILLKTDSPKIGARVLRSASGKKNDACSEPVNDTTSSETAVKKIKSCRASKDRSPKKEYVKICRRVRYVLNRMNYQQSFIQAYASEGWKGQSLEKIKPEKDLKRAKEEILQCKLRIREAFHNMDALLSEGKLEESLFDSAGEISSEDIFCAICASKDVTLQNDIILCDGACDRGFHQNCLKPPLRTEDIPPGDEGWLCPACVCKADSIDVLNELHGSKLSIHDSWEKVFPEAASFANGSKQVAASDRAPGHIEDNDYNPALAEEHMMNEDRFSAEDDGKVDDLGFPSEDSEDDDFDPAGSDSSEDQKNELNSEESDFTSNSDDFCAEIAKSCRQDKVSASPLLDTIKCTDGMKISASDNHSNEEISNRALIDMEPEQGMVLPISSRRQFERLDYKKLYDEAYGKESSGSSDDEEWSGEDLLEGSETDSVDKQLHPAKRSCRRAPAGLQNNEHTPQKELLHGSESEHQTEVLRSNGSGSTGRKFGPIATQKLKVHFEKDPYPSRATKENLAQELGLTFNQVCRWFSSSRHYSRVASAKKEKHPDNHTSENNDSRNVDSMQMREPNAGVMEKLIAERNAAVPEKPMVQNTVNHCNKDMPLSGTEIEMESYGQESSDSSDEEWSAFSTPWKARLQDNVTASPAESLGPAKRSSRRATAREQNNEHTPQSEQLHGSTSEQQTEVLCSNSSSSKTSKYHFGPIVNQKLKAHFEKDPYPSRATKESLAQELGLTFNQVNKWFSATRYYSRSAAAKNKKHPGKDTAENDNDITFDGGQVREPNVGVMEKPSADINDVIPEKLMVQINLNEGIEEDTQPSQYTTCEERTTMTPTVISREVGLPGYGPGENFFQVSSRNTRSEKNVITTPIAISREVSRPGHVREENQVNDAPWHTSCEQREFICSATMSREVGPPGYEPEENQGSDMSWNISCEQGVFMISTTISREAGPPGYGSRENQGSGTSFNKSCEQGMFTSPGTISEVGPPGFWPGEKQGNDTSPNMNCELRMFTSPTTISREVRPPGYEPGENEENGTSWNAGYNKGVFRSPIATSREFDPPGFGTGENQGSSTSWNMRCEQRMYTSPTTISREVRLPGFGSENQRNGVSFSTSSEQGVFTSPKAISREVGPPGYGPGESQGSITSWITSCKQQVFTNHTTVPSEGGPPGYSFVENQGTGGSRNINLEQRVAVAPATIPLEVFPPGYGPGENQGSCASGNVRNPQGKSAEKINFSDEARKRAIQRELRRRQKFR